MRASTIDFAAPPPFQDVRAALTAASWTPATGSMGGDPTTPTGMDWLWPVDDGDANKVLGVRTDAPWPRGGRA